MRVFWEQTATPREVAEEIDEPLNNVAYHVKVLLRLNCIELVQTRQARGGRVAEHFYKATNRHHLWDLPTWAQLSESEKLDVTRAIMQQVSEDLADAMASGTFNADEDNHISRTPLSLDDDGWDEVVSILSEALDKLLEVQVRVDERAVGGSSRKHHAKVEILHFRSPPPKTA